MKKHIFILILILTFAVNTVNTVTAAPEPSSPPAASASPAPTDEPSPEPLAPMPEIHAGAWILVDMNTGRVLFEQNADEKMFPASTTKILTGIMALEMLDMNTVLTATEAAIAPITLEHSSMGIYRGEELTVEQLLYGLLVHSANDAANVLAVAMGGSIEGFADMMNAKAAELGAVNSHFVNPHGFHEEDHYTTARDLSIIAKYAMQNEKFREIVKTTRYNIPPTNKYKTERNLITTNNLISKFKTTANFYSYATGIKTGSTSQALNCLVASAKKDDNEFLSVLMKCPNQGTGETAYSFADTKALFEYAFDSYKYTVIVSGEDIVADSKVEESKDNARVALSPKDEIASLLPKNVNLSADIAVDMQINENIEAPVEKGEVLGHAKYVYNGELLGETDLVASNSVERDNLLFIIHKITGIITSPFFYIPVAMAVVGGIIIRIRIVNNRRKRRRHERKRFRNNRY